MRGLGADCLVHGDDEFWLCGVPFGIVLGLRAGPRVTFGMMGSSKLPVFSRDLAEAAPKPCREREREEEKKEINNTTFYTYVHTYIYIFIYIYRYRNTIQIHTYIHTEYNAEVCKNTG